MRVLLVNDTLEKYGGAETYIYNLIDLLNEKRHEVEVFGSEKFQKRLSLFTRFYNIFNSHEFYRKVKEFKPDLVHIHKISHAISPSVLHIAKRMKIPLVMTVHDFHYLCPDDWFIFKDCKPCRYGFCHKCLITRCYRSREEHKYFFYHFYNIPKLVLHRHVIRKNVYVFIAPSISLAQWLRKNLKIDNIKIVPNFIDVDKISYKPIEDDKQILYVGRLSKEKGVHYLINAMPMILKEIPEAKLTVVGRGLEQNNLKKLSKKLKIVQNVSFRGYLLSNELAKCYQEAELVVVPSFWAESFALVTLEAMAHGRPIILSDIFGLSERIKDNDVGVLFEPGNSGDLADKVITLLSNFELVKKTSENARKKVVEKYSAGRHYRDIMKVYEGLL